MPYVVVEDFRGGVDRRRLIESGTPGTLWSGINGHITRGGEFEKRKAFSLDHTLPEDTFGLGATADALYVFGSVADPGVPTGITYQRLTHPDGVFMSEIIDVEPFDGKLYVIARYQDGSIHHFYDGAIVRDWDDGIVRAAMLTIDGVASHLAGLINANAAYNASASGAVITITAAEAGTPFTITREVQNVAGGTDDQAIALAQTQPNIAGISEVLATATFDITAGTSSAGVNKISSVTVDGIELIGSAVDWVTSNSGTATNLAAEITSNTSSPNYTATANGATVTITAAAGTGDGPNGFTVSTTVDGDVTTSSPTAMDGGVSAVSGQAQVYTATLSGTFEVGDRYTITIDDNVFGNAGNPVSKGVDSLTVGTKVYSIADSEFYYSAVTDPTAWNTGDTGAGFTNASNHLAGSETLTALGFYQGNLAVFARNATQIWSVSADDDLNVLLQPLENTGTRSPRSVLSMGNEDTFYLHDSGMRSLRARDSSNLANVNDVGTAIDDLIIEDARGLTDAQIESASAVIEPTDGRYWLAMGSKIYVYTSFPGSKIRSWSWYEPGFEVSDLVLFNSRVYARSGNALYLYGGSDGNTYDDTVATALLPFLTAGKPAHFKSLSGVDVAALGTWSMSMLVDPRNQDTEIDMGSFTDTTYGLAALPVPGEVTHFAPKLVSSGSGYAKLSNLAVHYELLDAE